jgi:ribosomal protein S18 acetylase RimI-like enzyme
MTAPPPPLHARAAVASDYAAFVRLWRELEVGAATPPTEAHWAARMMPSTSFLVAPSGEVVAYAMVFPHGARADVRQISVDPAWRRRGVGRQLMTAVAAQLRAAGCTEWRLEVTHDNAAAIALYARAGMRVLREIRIISIARTALAQLRTPGVTAAPLAPHAEAAIEAHYDLGAGELAQWRSLRPDSSLWVARDAATAELAGFARYCPTHVPGCALLFPCRARDISAAAQIAAAAMRAPLLDRVELCIVDTATGDALLAAGGVVGERQLEMTGAL